MKKKIIAAVLAVVLTVGAVTGGIVWKKNSSGKTVNVYPVSNLSTTYWGDSNESYGPVTTDQTQAVYLSETQTVKEVLVEEGQQVSKGDVLMTYDTTLTEVEVLKKDLSIQQMELDLKKAKTRLEKIKTYRPGVPVSEKNMVSGDTANDTAVVEAAIPEGIRRMTLTMGGWHSPMLLSANIDPGSTQETEDTPRETESTETQPTETQPTETQPTETQPTETQPTETQPTETQPTETQPTETQPTETQPTETQPTETQPTETQPSSTEPTTQAPEETDPIVYPKLIGGRGTKDVPFVFNWNGKWTFDQKLLAYLSQGRTDAYVRLQLDADEQAAAGAAGTTAGTSGAAAGADGLAEETAATWWTIEIKRTDAGEYTMDMKELCVNGEVVDLDPEPQPEAPVTPEEPEDPGYDPGYGGGDYGVTYTASEIATLLLKAQEEVRDLDLDLRVAKVEYQRMVTELNNGSVVSEIDGVVKTVREEADAKINNQALIDVSGGGGYYIKGTVGELDLDGIQPGTPVTVMSWETYMSYDGTVTEVSEYPLSYEYYGNGNTNSSYYNFTVFVDESADLKEYEYVSLTYTAEDQGGTNFYLENSMMRTENGKSYVYVENDEGRLEKRQIRTGKSLWGYYTEIISGLTEDDYVAFPYGTEVKEGAPAVEASTDELYQY